MLYTLQHPIKYDDKVYKTIELSDYLTATHQLAFGEAQSQSEVVGSITLTESFCEGLPEGAVRRLSLDDLEQIGAHITRVTEEFTRKKRKKILTPRVS